MSEDIIDLLQEAKEFVLDSQHFGGKRTPLENRATKIVQRFISIIDKSSSMTPFEREVIKQLERLNENILRIE